MEPARGAGEERAAVVLTWLRLALLAGRCCRDTKRMVAYSLRPVGSPLAWLRAEDAGSVPLNGSFGVLSVFCWRLPAYGFFLGNGLRWVRRSALMWSSGSFGLLLPYWSATGSVRMQRRRNSVSSHSYGAVIPGAHPAGGDGPSPDAARRASSHNVTPQLVVVGGADRSRLSMRARSAHLRGCCPLPGVRCHTQSARKADRRVSPLL